MENSKIAIREISQRITLITFTFLIFLSNVISQDKKVEIDIGVNREPVWYQQPWAWIVGAAIFILLLVALLRGGKKKG
ncbi:MAG: hypothetical protein ACXWCZ_10555 [Flavisolibacter sp.]